MWKRPWLLSHAALTDPPTEARVTGRVQVQELPTVDGWDAESRGQTLLTSFWK